MDTTTREIGTQLQNLCLKIGQGNIDWETIKSETEEMRKKAQDLGLTSFVKDCDDILEKVNATLNEIPFDANQDQ